VGVAQNEAEHGVTERPLQTDSPHSARPPPFIPPHKGEGRPMRRAWTNIGRIPLDRMGQRSASTHVTPHDI